MSADGLTARDRAHAIVEGATLGTYRFDRYLKEKSDKVIQSLAVVEPERRHQAVQMRIAPGVSPDTHPSISTGDPCASLSSSTLATAPSKRRKQNC